MISDAALMYASVGATKFVQRHGVVSERHTLHRTRSSVAGVAGPPS